MTHLKVKLLLWTLIVFLLLISKTQQISATVDPRNEQNNKVCVGILSPEADITDAANMVNAKSDWGYVVIIIKKSERDVDRWQGVFNQLLQNHLIPIVRIATDFDDQGYWQKPKEEDVNSWADFLSKLYFPTKNRYVQVYNEVNRAAEWGGNTDPADYARELDKMINALKAKSDDFFILNSPMDLALATGKDSVEAGDYFRLMEQAKPGIFSKLDGWASHSYPNPDFSASPLKRGRLGIDGYKWELSQIDQYTGGRNLPAFITETGWKRSNLLDENKIADYYQTAFGSVWSDSRVVTACPFVLNYPDGLFNSFSFKGDEKVLGKQFYNYYSKIQDLTKIVGKPVRENIAFELKWSFPEYLILERPKELFLTVRNVGNYVWDAKSGLVLNVEADGIKIIDARWNQDEVLPGREASVTFKIISNKKGDIPFAITLADNDQVLIEKQLSVKSETRLVHVIRIFKNIASDIVG